MLARFLYRSYSRFYRFSRFRQYHISPAGKLIMAAFFLSILLGINIYRTNLYMMSALAGCVIAISLVLNLTPFRCRVSVRRFLPDCVTAEKTAVYELEITNLSGSVQKGLILHENVCDPRPSYEQFVDRKEPFEDKRNWWDRKIKYYRWQWQVNKNKNAFLKPVLLPDLPAEKTIRVPLEVAPYFRGYVRFSGITLTRPDVVGLFRRRIQIDCPGKLLVLPKPKPFELPEPVSRRQYHPGGIQLASSIGNSDEFIGLRHYRPGDPLRNIHWKSFAKTGELVIREFEDEFFQRHALVLDTKFKADDEAIFEEAVSLAAHCVSELKTRDSVLDLMFAGDQVFSFSSGRGLGRPEKMLEVLACIEPRPDKDISDVIGLLKQNIHQFSGIVCIFSGWLSGHKTVFDLLKTSGLDFHMLILTDDKEKMVRMVTESAGSLENIQVLQAEGFQKEALKQ